MLSFSSGMSLLCDNVITFYFNKKLIKIGEKVLFKRFHVVFKTTKVHEWLLNMPSLSPPFKIRFPSESRTHPLQSALCTKYSFFSWLYCSTPTNCQEYSKAGLSGSTTWQTHEEQTFNFSHMCPYGSHWMGYKINLFSE